MAVASTATFTATRDQIVMDALAMVGATGPNRTPSANQLAHGARVLNDLVKSMDADGIFLWKLDRITFTTTDGTANYTLQSDVLEIDEPATYKPSSSNARTLLTPISRDDYMSISDRTVEGTPTQYYVERQLSGGHILYLYPTPDTTGDTVEYAGHVRGRDFSIGSNNPDFPVSWILCLKLGLAWLLAPTYGQSSRMGPLRDQYMEERMRQLGNDSEKLGISFVPFGWSNY